MQILVCPVHGLITGEHVAEGLSCTADSCLAAQQLRLKDSDFQFRVAKSVLDKG